VAELTAVLVSAFKIAWTDYYGQREGDDLLSKEVARPALAKFLVGKTREGIVDEAGLAAVGLQFLIDLETAEISTDDAASESASWQLSGTATARFIVEARIRLQMK
jgi:hypothetical protein